MITVAEMTQWFRKAFDETQSQMLAEATVRLHADLVHREDFSALTRTVERFGERTDRIAVAQEQTAQELREVAVAQKETAREVQALAVAQRMFTESQAAMQSQIGELTSTTKVMQSQIGELTSTTKVVQSQIGELTSISKASQEQIATLAWSIKDLRKQVGGLAQSVGCGLEAYAMGRIPRILAQQLGFVEESSGPEQFAASNGSQDDIDVVVRGLLEAGPVVFLCETVTRAGRPAAGGCRGETRRPSWPASPRARAS